MQITEMQKKNILQMAKSIEMLTNIQKNQL